ncbi:hypothetical protein ABG067_006910 [Albugo candida]
MKATSLIIALTAAISAPTASGAEAGTISQAISNVGRSLGGYIDPYVYNPAVVNGYGGYGMNNYGYGGYGVNNYGYNGYGANNYAYNSYVPSVIGQYGSPYY